MTEYGRRQEHTACTADGVHGYSVETAESRLLTRIQERLIEGEDHDALLDGDFDTCIAAICAELGLDAIPSRRSKAARETSSRTSPQYAGAGAVWRKLALAGLDPKLPPRTPRDCPSGR